jgi:oligopeptide transport system substrate-binding protein
MQVNHKKSFIKFGVNLTLCFTTGLTAFLSESVLASKPKTVTIALTTEPPNLDSSKATDTESFVIVGHTMEGLTRYDQKGDIVPAVAESWELTNTGVIFHLRKNARWSDGKPVEAKNFVYSWRRALDPKTASEYAFILYALKNGELINQGKLPLDQLGVVAKDANTLEVTFERPCGYFLGLTSFATYFPLREDFINKAKDKYASSPDTILSNGPFRLVNWVHGASLRLEKNKQYWNQASVQIDAIDVPYITPDATARFNLYKTEKIDMIQQLSKENIANAQREAFRLKKYADGSLWYFMFNFREGKITSNKNLRMAIRSVLNRTEFISRAVGIPGTLPGLGLIPSWMKGEAQAFRKEFPLPPEKQNIALAKEYLSKAMKELGLTSPPSISYLTDDTEGAIRTAEYLQGLFKTTLGIDLKIDKQIFKQRLAKQKSGDFEISMAGWGPDYNDPMTFADLFTSWNGNNTGKWVNKNFDQHIRNAMNTVDQKVRMSEMAAAEKLLLDDVAIIPTYERTIMYTHRSKIQGVARRPVGLDPDFTAARIEE